MAPRPSNGTHRPGVYPSGYPMPRVPISPYHGGLPQPYAIPARGAIQGPVGAVPHVPQLGSRGFGAGRGNANAPIGSHLSHQQASQQPIGSHGPNFNFSALENPNSQPSGGPLSQPGYASNVSKPVNSFNILSYSYCSSCKHVFLILKFIDGRSRTKPDISRWIFNGRHVTGN